MDIALLKKSHFNASEWLHYFQHNAHERRAIPWAQKITVAAHLHAPLIRSLQRFQVGEQGDGVHLRRAAAKMPDPAYSAAITLFIQEEQEHSRMLAKIINAMGGTLLQQHWSDTCFTLLRRLLGLRMELLVLLVAEIIAQIYYKILYDGTTDTVLREVFAQILADEDGHVSFHCAYLHDYFSHYAPWVRWLIYQNWFLLYRLVCAIVIYDHRSLLRALDVTPSQCWQAFMQAFHAATIFTA